MTSISIITAVYNGAATIADSIRSVRSQTYPAEHIIVDGASTDNTLDIISRLNPDVQRLTPDARLSRFTIHHSPFTEILSEPDKGIYDAMNKGIVMATGDVIGILNADDFYASPEVLAKVAAVFADERIDACYGDLVYVSERQGRESGGKDQSGVETHDVRGSGRITQNSKLRTQNFRVVRYWRSGTFVPQKFYQGWMPPHPTFFVRRSVYDRYDAFNLALGSAADYELMLRLLLKHRVTAAYIPEVLVKMRTGGASNASLSGRLRANRMDRRAWEVNGLKPYPWTLFLKPLRKVGQWFTRPVTQA